MTDYYSILGINQTADSAQIRAAYKSLALQYHPDRNPGNPQAEELFKTINEAYHILSDPLKRARYDARFTYQATYGDQTQAYWQEVQRQQYRRWRAQQESSRYRFDREYFRIQGLAFLTFLVIAGFCFGIIHTVNYVYLLQREKEEQKNRLQVVQVNSLFNSGRMDEAFSLINKLRNDYPMEFLFYATHDSLLYVIRERADREFNAQHFGESLTFLELLQKYETPLRLETIRKLAICEYQTGDFQKALVSLKQIYNEQPWNLDLLYQIGIIHLVNLNDPQQASTYFTLGKRIFKENMSRIYGDAFEVVMITEDVPDIYYEIFEARAKTNLQLKNFAEAETDCNWAIFLRPKKAEPYKMRVLAKVNQQNFRNVCKDLDMAIQLGAEGTNELKKQYCR